MRVTPKTEKEIYEADLLPDGWYPFTISKAEEKVSKAGNEMIELNSRIYRGEGYSFVKIYLMDTEFGAKILRHLAETCGLLDAYEAGELNAQDLIGKEGFAKIGREKSKDAQFGDKNKIWDFAKEEPQKKGEEAQPAVAGPGRTAPKTDDDDDIPFN